MELDTKKKVRRVLRGSFTKCSTELDSLLSQSGVEEIQVCWEILQEKFDELKIVNSEVFDLLLAANASEEDLSAEKDGCDVYAKRFKELNLRCTNILRRTSEENGIQSDRSSSGASSVVPISGKRKFKLPIIQFKRFDGNIRDWLSFWTQFRKVDEDPNIDLADKVEYLVQATIPGSRARHLVDSFPATGENYRKMIDSLKSRFGREDLQIEVYVRELLKLILNNAVSKCKTDISSLYDNIETQLRALETLGITSDKYSAMLFPLIESCLPEELIRVWQRSSVGLCAETLSRAVGEGAETLTGANTTLENRLKALIQFLRNEVENEQRILLASEGYGLQDATAVNSDLSGQSGTNSKRRTPKFDSSTRVPTAADLVNNSEVARCIFCEAVHESQSCFKARHFSFEKKKQLITEKRACFRCLRVGHQARKCRGRINCLVCHKQHVTLMCPDIKSNKLESQPLPAGKAEEQKQPEVNVANYTSTHVFLQTLSIKLIGTNGSCDVRALIDTGSQRSYILKSTAHKIGLFPKSEEKITHCLFGGVLSEQTHKCYDVKLVQNGYACKFEALDQPKICSDISPIFPGQWMEELENLNIEVHDIGQSTVIELLIGSDVAGKLYTGRRHVLNCGLVAVETLLGWTLMGKVPFNKSGRETALFALNLFVNDTTITSLWELDVLGISEPTESKTRHDLELAAKKFFTETVKVNSEGRYEVRLPWLEGHPPLPTNYLIAQKRLNNVLKRLDSRQLFNSYDNIFMEWLQEDIIEHVVGNSVSPGIGHYLPHRPVVKENSSTTKIRPVFDAGAKQKNKPSLNHCLEKGPNLIEEIPNILIRFREHKIGVISDIRKAFLQIAINDSDRDCLRFLWIDSEGNEIIFRHRRVVFGVNSSPFLLGATIHHHLAEIQKKCEASELPYSSQTISKLSRSFYVDNCVTSIENEDTLRRFIQESTQVMLEGKFELRGWERTQYSGDDKNEVLVLGFTWNTRRDTLSIKDCLKSLEGAESEVVTKRLILSMAQRVFDPIGFTSPTTLLLKLLLQRIWEIKLGWDVPVGDDIKEEFHSWVRELKHLETLEIPRWIKAGREEVENLSFHVFCDASSKAFACAIFLRVEEHNNVFVHLLAAKSRVAPMKKMTIPRLELLSATIAARLYAKVQGNLEKRLPGYFWSDSSTVLSWIRRKDEWATFVGNRVAEIRSLTPISAFRHVLGVLNPADLPSRGCSAKHLAESQWWEGPRWLYEAEELWPQEEQQFDEEEINREKKKTITAMVNNHSDEWHFAYFSCYIKIIRMMAWIFRFAHNARHEHDKRRGSLTAEELDFAELFIFRVVQGEAFVDNDPRLKSLDVFRDKSDIIRLRPRVSNRKDEEHFRFPIVLPSKHRMVEKLIFQTHEKSCHVGTQGLLSLLREKYWVLGGRRYVKSVISKCVICRRHTAKHFQAQSPALPTDRVRDAVAFEVTGVDFAGPLYLKSGDKVWVCVFTCSVYRAVHFELASSLSTPCFLRALRRFVARRGRPKVIYSDNGTNFVGTENLFEKLNWNEIVESSSVERIIWRFNPPTAAWWGGFWEGIVGILKKLLRKVLGRASVDYEDLLTLVCDCESIINSRPLTYMSNDASELVPLTPVMFTRDLVESGLPDGDTIDKLSMCKKVRRMQKLRDDLRRRFRSEYLGQLRLLSNAKPSRNVAVGEVVLVGSDNDKRLDWPIGRVVELLPGKDGQVRLVRIVTARGQLLRPIQRVYPLEENGVPPDGEAVRKSEVVQEQKICESEKTDGSDESYAGESGSDKSRVPVPKLTRCGRIVKLPSRYLDN